MPTEPESEIVGLTTDLAAKENTVVHGATAGTARPAGATVVHWIGSVQPTNAATNDEWTDTTNKVVKRFNGSTWDSLGAVGTTDTGKAPNLITGSPALGFWYKASSLALSDGTAVTTWTDSSGNSRDVTQATSTKRPIYKAAVAGLGGAPAVLFDGVDDTLINAAVTGLTSGTWTVFAVVSELVNATGPYVVDARSGGPTFVDLTRAAAGPGFRAGDTTLCTPLNWPQRMAALWLGVYDGTTMTMFVNGQMIAQTGLAATSAAPSSIYLGSNADTGGSYWNGHIAEVGAFTSALTASQRGELRRYCAATYGVMSWGP